ncbi:recombination-associated protein RdgC [Halomonas sp. LBP4]|uniref:recombination-associated protein RdgC n=1 Tax=Halomonas sp. LBP4 TaxID=2044917 RepID=UPI000D75EAFB|nr:recombination-associated protein RdgC [Halomonas sp. LBP4]PXX95952.1 recombination-associated protein RdgC [Halomonas sp. LBP4]
MWFKTAILHRIHQPPELAADALASALEEHMSRPLGGSEPKRMGWTAPAGRKSDVLLHELQGHRLMTALRQERLLPASVVREEVEERCDEIEEREGRKLRRQERLTIKEQVIEELLPRAFVRSKKVDLWWDTRRDLICVSAGSRKAAEEVLDLLRETLGSLKVTPLATQELPVRAMTRWLSEPDSRPAWLLLGDQAQLKSKGDDASFTARQADLEGDEVRSMVEAGRQATRIAITLEGQASLVLQDDFTFKSLRFDDALIEEANNAEDDGDAVIRLETDFVLMADALAHIIEQMLAALGGEAKATPAAAEAPQEDTAEEGGASDTPNATDEQAPADSDVEDDAAEREEVAAFGTTDTDEEVDREGGDPDPHDSVDGPSDHDEVKGEAAEA